MFQVILTETLWELSEQGKMSGFGGRPFMLIKHCYGSKW